MNRGPLVTGGVEVAALYPHQVRAEARRGCAARRRANRPAVRRRAHRGLDLHPLLQRRLRLEARVARRPRSGDRVHRPRRRRRARAPRNLALAVGHSQHRRAARGRHDQLAPGAPSGGPHRARRPPRSCSRGCASEPQLQLLDVRERTSGRQDTCRARSSCPGTTSRRCPRSLDAERPIAIICAGGVRAATAASLLKRAGAEQVIHVIDGGVPALARLGLELESAAPAGLVG